MACSSFLYVLQANGIATQRRRRVNLDLSEGRVYLAPVGLLASSGRAAAHGVTLPELMVTVAVVAIIATAAVPAFGDFIAAARLDSAASNLSSSLQLARSEAIKSNATVAVCRSSDGASCAASGGWEAGWLVFRDSDGDGTVDEGEPILYAQQALAAGFFLRSDAASVPFGSTGQVEGITQEIVFDICGTQGIARRALAVSPIGRVTTRKTTGTSCP